MDIHLHYCSGDPLFMLIDSGKSPNSYEPDYAYDTEEEVELRFPDDPSRYTFDGVTRNPLVEELLDDAIAELDLVRYGSWEYGARNGVPEINCALRQDV